MGIRERREREKARRREEILDAAEKLFETKGLAETTMDEIAARAEISKATIYLYFKCKEHLYFGLDYRGSQIENERFRLAVASESVGLDQVLAIGRAYCQYGLDYPTYFWAKTRTGKVSPELVQSLQDDPMAGPYQQLMMENHTILANAVERGIGDGSIRPELDTRTTSLVLWAEANGVVELILTRGEILAQTLGRTPEMIIEGYIDSTKHSLKT